MSLAKLFSLFGTKEETPTPARPDQVVDLLLQIEKSIEGKRASGLAKNLEDLEKFATTDELKKILEIGITRYCAIASAEEKLCYTAEIYGSDCQNRSDKSKIGQVAAAEFKKIMDDPGWTEFEKLMFCLKQLAWKSCQLDRMPLRPYITAYLEKTEQTLNETECQTLIYAMQKLPPEDDLHGKIYDRLLKTLELIAEKNLDWACDTLHYHLLSKDSLQKNRALYERAHDTAARILFAAGLKDPQNALKHYGQLIGNGYTGLLQPALKLVSRYAESATAHDAAHVYIDTIQKIFYQESRERTLALKGYQLFLEDLACKTPLLAAEVASHIRGSMKIIYEEKAGKAIAKINEINDAIMLLAYNNSLEKNPREALVIAKTCKDHFLIARSAMQEKALSKIFSANSGVSAADLEKTAEEYAAEDKRARKIYEEIIAARRKAMSPAVFMHRFG